MTFDDDRWREALPWFFLLTAVWSLTQQVGVLIMGYWGRLDPCVGNAVGVVGVAYFFPWL